jgi:hypothetical protein
MEEFSEERFGPAPTKLFIESTAYFVVCEAHSFTQGHITAEFSKTTRKVVLDIDRVCLTIDAL